MAQRARIFWYYKGATKPKDKKNLIKFSITLKLQINQISTQATNSVKGNL
jgi:hypothetical protein